MNRPTTSTSEQESQDEVLKSGFSLNKLVSTTGQPSPALKLEGAGFTVYRISKLSKAAQFKQNPDGSYDAQSILDTYRKDNYDNLTLKYDFTAEGQAIANMFESSTDTVNAYNATLTPDGDYANGRATAGCLRISSLNIGWEKCSPTMRAFSALKDYPMGNILSWKPPSPRMCSSVIHSS